MENIHTKQQRSSGNYFSNEKPTVELNQERPVIVQENEWIKTFRIVFRWKSLKKTVKLIAKLTGISRLIRAVSCRMLPIKAKLKENLHLVSHSMKSKYMDAAEEFFSYQDKFINVPFEITNSDSVHIQAPVFMDAIIDQPTKDWLRSGLITFIVGVLIIALSIFNSAQAKSSSDEIIFHMDKPIPTQSFLYHYSFEVVNTITGERFNLPEQFCLVHYNSFEYFSLPEIYTFPKPYVVTNNTKKQKSKYL
ncbi:MAG: hypothetical protein JEZ03_07730 [Bacteroidales bacterium]|nr:hypothetical protein [Bacteroidales bacterium]